MATEDSVDQCRFVVNVRAGRSRSGYSARPGGLEVVAAGEEAFASGREGFDGGSDSIGDGWW